MVKIFNSALYFLLAIKLDNKALRNG